MSDSEQCVSNESLPSASMETPPPARRKLASYDAKFKLNVITYAENHTNRKASKKFGVGELVVLVAALMALRIVQSIVSSQVELHIALWPPSKVQQPARTATQCWTRRILLLIAIWKKTLLPLTMNSRNFSK